MTPEQRQMSEQLYGGQRHSAIDAIKEAVLTAAPGLKDFAHESKKQLDHMADLGRSELANALFGHGAFVLYSHEPKKEQGMEGPEHAQDGPSLQQDRDQHLGHGLSM